MLIALVQAEVTNVDCLGSNALDKGLHFSNAAETSLGTLLQSLRRPCTLPEDGQHIQFHWSLLFAAIWEQN